MNGEQKILLKEKHIYKYLIASALVEEMQAFYNTNAAFLNRRPLEGEVEATELTFSNSKKAIILTFASARMGMPHNAAAIMQIIEMYQPIYVFFIGCCATLKNSGVSIGDVIVPKTVFNYELGKYEKFKFIPDNESYKLSERILRHSESIIRSSPSWMNFNVITDDDFSSGSIVVNSASKRRAIKKLAPRKANGLDMEAYSLGAIQYLQKLKHIGVIKGVMDLGHKKTDCKKSEAINNAARFTYELLKKIEEIDSNKINSLQPIAEE